MTAWRSFRRQSDQEGLSAQEEVDVETVPVHCAHGYHRGRHFPRASRAAGSAS